MKFFYFYTMKNLVLILLFMGGFLAKSQYLIEDNDITENSNEFGRAQVSFDLNNPLEFYRLKCENAKYAQFPGGESAFKQMLFNALKSTINQGNYSVNGTFEFVLNIDKNGNLHKFTLKPEVQNGDLLYRDLNFMFGQMKQKWIPATCNGVATDSKLRIRVNFRTENFDL